MKPLRLRLRRTIQKIKDILLGKTLITDRYKFTALICCIASVHVFLLILFGIFRVMPLFYFNIFSVATYLTCFILLHSEHKHYLVIFCIAYIEIILHSFVATICLGWKYGFAQYIIAIIPVGYYIFYTLNIQQRKFMFATLLSLFSVFSFLCCKVLSFYGTPICILENEILELFLYIFNSICTFIFLILFSLVFIFEIRLSSSQLKQQNAILEKLASTDPLTGLYNRRSMDVFLSQAVESDSNFALVMCDIDDFKKVNDSYGHDFGDVVLKGIASITAEQVREQGYVCRWGGEEILILINNASEESAYLIAESVRRKVANRVFELNDRWIRCSLTLGIALHNKKETVEETITRADYNLYCGKRNGKNAVVL